MLQIKNPDLTTSGQKTLAGVIVVGGLGLLWFLLPPLITIMTNLYLAIGLAIPLVAGVVFRERIWEESKRLSWNLTKKLISNDKLWYMWRGYEYLVNKNEALNNDIKNISTIRHGNQSKLQELSRSLSNELANAARLEERAAPETVLKVARNKVAMLQGQVNMITPRIESIKKQETDLISLYEIRVADTEILKQSLEAKAQELEMMESMSKASDNASAWLKNSPEMKTFNESLKQIDTSISTYTANVENFQRNILPTIASSSSTGNEEEGRLLIEKYKSERLQLN